MASEVKTNKISPATGTDVTLGDTSDTFTVPSGSAITVASGGEIDIASGATLDVNGIIDVTGATTTGFPGNTPSFGAYRATDSTYTDDTWTIIPMDTEEWDTDSAFDNSAYTFTVPADKAGKYFFSMTTTLTNSGGAQEVGTIRLAIYKGASGGSSSALKQEWFDGAGAKHQWRGMTLTGVIDLIVGDFVQFYAYVETLNTPTLIGGQSMTFCSGFKLA